MAAASQYLARFIEERRKLYTEGDRQCMVCGKSLLNLQIIELYDAVPEDAGWFEQERGYGEGERLVVGIDCLCEHFRLYTPPPANWTPDPASQVAVQSSYLAIIKRSEKAVQVKHHAYGQDRYAWLPLSQITLDEAAQTVTLPRWLANKHDMRTHIS